MMKSSLFDNKLLWPCILYTCIIVWNQIKTKTFVGGSNNQRMSTRLVAVSIESCVAHGIDQQLIASPLPAHRLSAHYPSSRLTIYCTYNKLYHRQLGLNQVFTIRLGIRIIAIKGVLTFG